MDPVSSTKSSCSGFFEAHFRRSRSSAQLLSDPLASTRNISSPALKESFDAGHQSQNIQREGPVPEWPPRRYCYQWCHVFVIDCHGSPVNKSRSHTVVDDINSPLIFATFIGETGIHPRFYRNMVVPDFSLPCQIANPSEIMAMMIPVSARIESR